MSLQLILYPQYFNGLNPYSNNPSEFFIDGIDFNTVNTSSDSINLSGTLPQAFISANTFNVNTFYRFSNLGASVVESNGQIAFSSLNGILQRLSNLNIGATYEISIDVATNTIGFDVFQFNGNVQSSQVTITGTGVQTFQFTAQSTTDTIAFFQTSGVAIINSISITQVSITTAQLENLLSNGQVIVDLYEDEDIPLTLSVDNFKNVIEKVQSYSKAFKLPATKRNNKIFDNIFEITRSDSGIVFNPYLKTQCELKQDGYILFEGYLRLIEINDKEGETSYNVNLYSEAVALADILKEKKFSDLDFKELNHDYNKTNIKASWNESPSSGITYLNASTSGYRDANDTLKYPFVDWQHDILISNGNNGTSGYPELSSLEQVFRPFIQVKYLIDRIFQDTVFSYESEFFNTTDFKKLYMDFNWGSAGIPSQNNVTQFTGVWAKNFLPATTNSSVNAGTVFTNLELYSYNIFNVPLPPNYNTSTHKITATNDGEQYNIVGNYQIENTSASVSQSVTCQWIKNNTDVLATQTFTLGASAVTSWNFNFTEVLLSGDTLEAQFKRDSASSPATIRQFEASLTTTANVNFNLNQVQITSGTLLQTLRGELGQFEFLKGLMTMFNLVTIPDKQNPNNLIIEPYGDVFIKSGSGTSLANRGIAYDWTNKIDVEEIKLQPLTDLNKITKFKFVEDEDDYTFKIYKNSTQSPSEEMGHLYGSLTFDASGFTILEGEDEIVAEPFAATVPKPLFDQFGDFIVPAIFTANDEQTEFEGFDNSPRILYNNGVKTLQGGVEYYIPPQNGLSSENQSNFLQFTHLTDIPTITPSQAGVTTSQDYHFGACQYFNGIGAPPSENLFTLYWLPYFSELYDSDTRIMTLKVNLTASDIATFNMYDSVFIKNREYRVNKIDYKPNDLSIVEFILVK
tara:strand:- start:4570 stop:7311 length:2742 start_codon:yes stop_codon:yes gene_type:complete